MVRVIRIMLVAVISLAIMAACATRQVKDKDKLEVTIAPHRSYEECITLFGNQVLDYSFTASKPLDFNIHYHAEQGIMFPVSQKSVSSWQGTFSPLEEKSYSKEQEYFCMMWESHNSEGVELTCQYKVVNK